MESAGLFKSLMSPQQMDSLDPTPTPLPIHTYRTTHCIPFLHSTAWRLSTAAVSHSSDTKLCWTGNLRLAATHRSERSTHTTHTRASAATRPSTAFRQGLRMDTYIVAISGGSTRGNLCVSGLRVHHHHLCCGGGGGVDVRVLVVMAGGALRYR